MLRFRNPGSNVETQIAIFRTVYAELKHRENFTYGDMEQAVGKTSLMTSFGYAGAQALAITSQRADSLNSTKMNMKMYAELFRLLGWISPAVAGQSYPVRFTLLGVCAGESAVGAMELVKQSLIGFVNPSEHNPGVKFTEHVRFFPLALRSLRDLGGIMHKHELCIGPMSCDEALPGAYEAMLDSIRSIRGDYRNLQTAFSELAEQLNMKHSSVDNMTRFPIGSMRDVGWIETQISNRKIYNKPLKCIRLTETGEQTLDSLSGMRDIRLEDLKTLSLDSRQALIRVGVFSMLKRAGYKTGHVDDQYQADLDVVESSFGTRDVLFSPYQTLRVDEVDQAIGISSKQFQTTHPSTNTQSANGTSMPQGFKSHDELVVKLTASSLNHSPPVSTWSLRSSCEELKIEIKTMQSLGMNDASIVENLFEAHRLDKHAVFYPFVADLFTLIGLPCRESRAGDNGARWDAIVLDDEFSIPIEIKSPTEEAFLSLKAVRQALENKIVLLSRETHPTTFDTTSLAVGYEAPNSRAEVARLIDNVHAAYQIVLGVITLRPLLMLAVKAITNDQQPDPNVIRNLKGILEVV